ncbi:Hypothetical predicted protein [Mytilus galloprovincialis]|uniref:Uncharacterized protein n=1 Tax=Mytilus galloprovincialis TaxID=29158 RepID=A0A8B6HDP7_MYTGA|nr:Hypothetical predicted protein [Mytilus galloprovincialis]
MGQEDRLVGHPPDLASPVASPYVIRKRKKMPKTTTSKKPRQEAVLLSTEEGIHDPYAYRSPSISPQLPLHLEAPSPTSPIVPTPTPTSQLYHTLQQKQNNCIYYTENSGRYL